MKNERLQAKKEIKRLNYLLANYKFNAQELKFVKKLKQKLVNTWGLDDNGEYIYN